MLCSDDLLCPLWRVIFLAFFECIRFKICSVSWSSCFPMVRSVCLCTRKLERQAWDPDSEFNCKTHPLNLSAIFSGSSFCCLLLAACSPQVFVISCIAVPICRWGALTDGISSFQLRLLVNVDSDRGVQLQLAWGRWGLFRARFSLSCPAGWEALLSSHWPPSVRVLHSGASLSSLP